MCFEFVMELEGTERTVNLLLGGNLLLFSNLEAFLAGMSEKTEEVGEASVLCPYFTHHVDHLFRFSRQSLLM